MPPYSRQDCHLSYSSPRTEFYVKQHKVKGFPPITRTGSDMVRDMVEIHLYGDLRRHGEQPRTDRPTVVRVPLDGTLTVAQVLQQIGIAPQEVGQVFLNHKLLNSKSTMAPWLGYQAADERIPASSGYLEAVVLSGDRLGLFPVRMAMLVV
jgi:hypothetical protein